MSKKKIKIIAVFILLTLIVLFCFILFKRSNSHLTSSMGSINVIDNFYNEYVIDKYSLSIKYPKSAMVGAECVQDKSSYALREINEPMRLFTDNNIIYLSFRDYGVLVPDKHSKIGSKNSGCQITSIDLNKIKVGIQNGVINVKPIYYRIIIGENIKNDNDLSTFIKSIYPECSVVNKELISNITSNVKLSYKCTQFSNNIIYSSKYNEVVILENTFNNILLNENSGKLSIEVKFTND